MRAVFALALLCSGLPACDDASGDGSGLRNTEFPDLRAEPDSLVFAVVPVGQTTTKEVVLRNAGGERIQITGLSLSNSLDSREFELEHVELPTIIGSAGDVSDAGGNGDRILLRVHYSPRDEGTDRGSIEVEASTGALSIPVASIESEAELIVQPERLVFVAADQTPETREVSLQNIGNVPVRVTGVYLSDESSADFTLVNDDLPLIEQGDTHEYSVTYTPRAQGGADGTLFIETDNAAYERIPVPLRGELPAPDIDVTPGEVVFPATDLDGRSEPRTVLVENLGTAALTVSAMSLGLAPGNTNEQFEVSWPDLPFELAPLASTAFEIVYAPTEPGLHATSVAIESDDPDESITTVALRGRVRRPCIDVSTERLDFGAVALGQDSAELPLRIANCGDLPLNLESLRLVGDGFSSDDLAAANGVELLPLAAVDVHFKYHNAGLAQGAEAAGTLTITNNTPDQPEVEVALHVVGGGAPSCNLVPIPNRLSFGIVSRNREVIRTVQLANAGTGRCEIRTERVANIIDIPLPGFEVPFFLTRPAGRRQVAPGEFVDVEITFRPQIFLAYQANYTVTYWDPFAMVEKTAQALLTGTGGESEIHVIPGHVEFGRVTAGECASREEHVTIYNTGIIHLCITGIRFEGDCEEFILVDRPVADADGCILVTRHQPAEISLVYEPANLGEDACEMVLESDADNNRELRVPLTGEGVRERGQTDEWVQDDGRTVDVLFVVDNSGSMGEEQRNLSDNFDTFIAGAERFENNYQLGVVTTDMQNDAHQGRLVAPRVMERGPGIEGQFQDAIRVGTNGAGEERGLEASQRALSDPLAFDTGVMCGGDADCQEPDTCIEGVCGGQNRGFLREEAVLEVVYVSDEDDQSTAALDFYVDFLKSIKGFRNESRMHAHAIVGAADGRAANCASDDGDASAGRRYVEVANRTGGQVHSICEGDFGRALRSIGNQAFGGERQFVLSRPAVRASIEVTVDGQRVDDRWVFDEETNSIIFNENQEPEAGQRIRATYEARCFPRRGD